METVHYSHRRPEEATKLRELVVNMNMPWSNAARNDHQAPQSNKRSAAATKPLTASGA